MYIVNNIGICVNFMADQKMIENANNEFKNNVINGYGSKETSTVSDNNKIWVTFAESMGPMIRPIAKKVANKVLYSNDERYKKIKVLDIAAGHGFFGIEVGLLNKEAEIVGLDWKAVLEVAFKNAKSNNMENRYTKLPGSAFEFKSYGDDFDIVLVPNFIHHFNIEQNEIILKKII